MTSSERAAAGFTLLEVMVALVIVALGMIAVSTQLGRYTTSAIVIEQKTLASWIATNKITELSVSGVWPEVGDNEEVLEYAGRLWQVRTEVAETDVSELRRVDVYVSFEETPDDLIHQVMGLIEAPPPRGFVPATWAAPRIEAGG